MGVDNSRGSFILHRDMLDVVSELDIEQTASLFKAIINYQNGDEYRTDNQLVNVLMVQFVTVFKRDEVKWKDRVDRSKINGSKGGRPKKTQQVNEEPTTTQDNLEKPTITQHVFNKPRKPVSVSDSVSDSVSVSKKKSKVLTPVVCTSAHDTILKWYNHIFKTNVRKIGTEDRKRLDKYISEYDVDGCIEILLGVTQDAWMMGEDAKNSTKYIGWGNIFKLNEDNFSRFSTKYHAATSNGAKWVKDITSPVGVSWWSQEHFSMSTAPDTHPWRVIQEPDIFTSGLLNDKFEYVWTEDEIKIYTEHLESQRADKIATQEAVLEGYQNPDDDTLPDSWVIGDLEPVEDIAPWVDTNTPEPVF